MSRLKIQICEFLFFREMLIFKVFIDYSIFFALEAVWLFAHFTRICV